MTGITVRGRRRVPDTGERDIVVGGSFDIDPTSTVLAKSPKFGFLHPPILATAGTAYVLAENGIDGWWLAFSYALTLEMLHSTTSAQVFRGESRRAHPQDVFIICIVKNPA